MLLLRLMLALSICVTALLLAVLSLAIQSVSAGAIIAADALMSMAKRIRGTPETAAPRPNERMP